MCSLIQLEVAAAPANASYSARLAYVKAQMDAYELTRLFSEYISCERMSIEFPSKRNRQLANRAHLLWLNDHLARLRNKKVVAAQESDEVWQITLTREIAYIEDRILDLCTGMGFQNSAAMHKHFEESPIAQKPIHYYRVQLKKLSELRMNFMDPVRHAHHILDAELDLVTMQRNKREIENIQEKRGKLIRDGDASQKAF